MTTSAQVLTQQASEASNHSAHLADLPPELWDQIAHYIPTASSISHLGQTSRAFATFVERDGWKTFSRTRFPSLCPTQIPAGDTWCKAARNLTTTSRAWDRRAIVAKYIEPCGDIYTYPGPKRQDRWQRPRGQTIGFTPHLGVHEDSDVQGAKRETLAFSAGAEICVRLARKDREQENVRWVTYRPSSVREGIDDVTALHLLSPESQPGTRQGVDEVTLIKGTAKGDLQLLRVPTDSEGQGSVQINYFVTEGAPVRSTSVCFSQSNHSNLLAASLGDSNISVFNIDAGQQKIAASSQIDIKAYRSPNSAHLQSTDSLRTLRTWCTMFLSLSSLAVGVGPSTSPIRIYSLGEAGLSEQPVRELSLSLNDDVTLQESSSMTTAPKRPLSSVYTVVPLSSHMTGSSTFGNVFLSGAYDGVIRLHDLRSPRNSEQTYIDPTNDNPIYSLLPRGQERMLAGTSRYNLLKVFDLRLGARCYDYLEARPDLQGAPMDLSSPDFNLYLRTSADRSRRRRYADSSVYTLAAASASSPIIYAGVENNVLRLEMKSMGDSNGEDANVANVANGRSSQDVQRLAMHEQSANFRMMMQREPLKVDGPATSKRKDRKWILDERWVDAAETEGGRW